MVLINGKKFWEKPCMCGSCPFFLSAGKGAGMKDNINGFCTQFDKRKSQYSNLPKRCNDLFDKAFTYPDGTELVITIK
jgi:hypothetical protein